MNVSQPIAPVKTPATLQVLEKFGRVIFACDGEQFECSTKTAIFELQRTKRTLDNVLLVDLDQAYRRDNPPSRQCQQVLDALLSAGLPDPAFNTPAPRHA